MPNTKGILGEPADVSMAGAEAGRTQQLDLVPGSAIPLPAAPLPGRGVVFIRNITKTPGATGIAWVGYGKDGVRDSTTLDKLEEGDWKRYRAGETAILYGYSDTPVRLVVEEQD